MSSKLSEVSHFSAIAEQAPATISAFDSGDHEGLFFGKGILMHALIIFLQVL